MRDERVGKRVVHMPGAGMAHETGLLREDHEVLVLEANVQGDVGIGGENPRHRLRLGKRHLQAVAQAEPLAL